jgi:hypothetical protein
VAPNQPPDIHARRQKKYYKKKMATHMKVCRWVPNEHVEAFNKSVERMKKKWEKQ